MGRVLIKEGDMKVFGIGLALWLVCSATAQAQCVAEVKSIYQDATRGSIIVETEYTLNSVVVQLGRTRYDENSGTLSGIIQKAKDDIKEHCENLIRRIATNLDYLNSEKLKQQKALTTPLITSMQSTVGFESTSTEAMDSFKGKDIKVTYDSKNTVVNTP